MKYIALFCIASLSVISCSSPANKRGATDTVVARDTSAKLELTEKASDAPAISSQCFLRTWGERNKDSASIELVIKGNEVTGQMNWMPYQKDSRKGLLKGKLTGDKINAQWSFMQEGMQDTLNLKFKLQDTQLTQKPLKLNTQTGREQTDDSADYSVSYQSSNKLHH